MNVPVYLHACFFSMICEVCVCNLEFMDRCAYLSFHVQVYC